MAVGEQAKIRVFSFFKETKGRRQWLPEGLARRAELSAAAKLVWSRLARYEGKKGKARPKQATLAQEVGLSLTQTRRALAELKKHNLISVKLARWQHRPNRYEFLDHPWLRDVIDRPKIKKHPAKQTDHQRSVTVITGDGPTDHRRRSTPPRVITGDGPTDHQRSLTVITGDGPLKYVNEVCHVKDALSASSPAAPQPQASLALNLQENKKTPEARKRQKNKKTPEQKTQEGLAHKATIDTCVQVFEAHAGNKYSFSTRDAKAVQLMLKTATQHEVVAAWGAAIKHQGFPSVTTLWQLHAHWNFFSLGEKTKQKQDVRQTKAQKIDDVDWSAEEQKWQK